VESRVCGAQAISGTGSLRLGMQFLRKFYASEVAYVSKPTWGKREVISNSNTYFKAFSDYFKMGFQTLQSHMYFSLVESISTENLHVFQLFVCSGFPKIWTLFYSL